MRPTDMQKDVPTPVLPLLCRRREVTARLAAMIFTAAAAMLLLQ